MKKVFVVLCMVFNLFIHANQSDKEIDNEYIDLVLSNSSKKYFELYNFLEDVNKQPSLKTLEELVNQCKLKNYVVGQVFGLIKLGNIYRRTHNYDKSISKLLQALKITNTDELFNAKIHCLNMLGVCYRWKSDIKNSMDFHQKVLRLTSNLDDPTYEILFSRAIAFNSVGQVYSELKQYLLAIEQFEEAIKIQKSIDNKKGLAINFVSLGYAHEKIQNLDRALNNYSKALTKNNEIKSTYGRVISNLNIANVYILKGLLAPAKEVLDAVKIDLKGLDDTFTAKYLMIKGSLNLKSNNLKDAEKYLLKAKELYKDSKNQKIDIINLNYLLSKLYDKNKNSKRAFYYYKKAVDQEKKSFDDRNLLYVGNLIYDQDVESKKSRIKELESKNKLQFYETSRNRNILIITLVSLTLLTVALYSIYRQRLLNNDKKVLTLEQEALQSQMNPHFIFNALNSIKLYIINNDKKQAVYYLNKFSKLIRNILDVSSNREVSLKEELSTMSLYMSIENIRFNNEIKYVSNIEDSVNLNTIKIPPLVLQPFLENAIWHGLSSKKGDKEIVLSAKQFSTDIIEISITDNGVGREKAMKIKKEKSLNRKSVGIELTKERLKTFSSDRINDYSLKYIDLFNENKEPKGTKVVLKLPII